MDIFTTWRNVTTHFMERLASSTQQLISEVINSDGGATHFWELLFLFFFFLGGVTLFWKCGPKPLISYNMGCFSLNIVLNKLHAQSNVLSLSHFFMFCVEALLGTLVKIQPCKMWFYPIFQVVLKFWSGLYIPLILAAVKTVCRRW